MNQDEMEEREILTTDQVMKLLAVARPTVYKLIKEDGLPAKKVRDRYRFIKSEVLEWLGTKNAV